MTTQKTNNNGEGKSDNDEGGEDAEDDEESMMSIFVRKWISRAYKAVLF